MSSSLGQRLLRAVDRLEEAFMIVALTLMTVLTFVQVVLRRIDGGFVWSLEATTYVFAWLVLIGMSYGVRTDAHIAVDLLTSRLPPRWARAVALAALAFALVYCGFMIYGTGRFVAQLMAFGTNARDIPLPRWLLTGIMPIAFGLLGLRFVQFASRVSQAASHAEAKT